MSDVKHNAMTPPREVDQECLDIFNHVKQDILDEIKRLNKQDYVHHLHEMDLCIISEYTPVLYATEDVSFGRNYFAKIHLGDEKYIHARAHKGNDHKISFYMLQTEPERAIWDKDTPLVYFID
ncbi:hypothetical protein BGZ76_006392 [Entomortierella beljakovae]|nr:hypothetical protein BGZ76_006392 [Entomortierella beljakovae]